MMVNFNCNAIDCVLKLKYNLIIYFDHLVVKIIFYKTIKATVFILTAGGIENQHKPTKQIYVCCKLVKLVQFNKPT